VGIDDPGVIEIRVLGGRFGDGEPNPGVLSAGVPGDDDAVAVSYITIGDLGLDEQPEEGVLAQALEIPLGLLRDSGFSTQFQYIGDEVDIAPPEALFFVAPLIVVAPHVVHGIIWVGHHLIEGAEAVSPVVETVEVAQKVRDKLAPKAARQKAGGDLTSAIEVGRQSLAAVLKCNADDLNLVEGAKTDSKGTFVCEFQRKRTRRAVTVVYVGRGQYEVAAVGTVSRGNKGVAWQ
jgi:hypothetical protein